MRRSWRWRRRAPRATATSRRAEMRPGSCSCWTSGRLVIPDRPGNRRLDNMQNILENPHVGLLFIVPGLEETLRVNGRAWITRDEEILGRMAVGTKRPHPRYRRRGRRVLHPLRQGLQALRPLGAVALAGPLGPALDRAGPRRPPARPGLTASAVDRTPAGELQDHALLIRGAAVACRACPALTCRAARGYVFECAPPRNRAAHRGEPARDRARGRVPTRRTR